MPQLLAHLFGDYILQSDWMAQNKTKRSWPCLVHCLLYALCFVPLCWQAAQHIPERHIEVQPTRVVIHAGDFTSKAVNIDGSYKEPAQDTPGRFHLWAWLVIFGTHFLIDRYRLARYVVWAKNWLGPWKHWANVQILSSSQELRENNWIAREDVSMDDDRMYLWHHSPTLPLYACPTGYPPSTPPHMADWLLIIADNTLHLAINYLALRYL